MFWNWLQGCKKTKTSVPIMLRSSQSNLVEFGMLLRLVGLVAVVMVQGRQPDLGEEAKKKKQTITQSVNLPSIPPFLPKEATPIKRIRSPEMLACLSMFISHFFPVTLSMSVKWAVCMAWNGPDHHSTTQMLEADETCEMVDNIGGIFLYYCEYRLSMCSSWLNRNLQNECVK